MDSEHHAVALAFDTDDAEFARGVEVGRLWERLRAESEAVVEMVRRERRDGAADAEALDRADVAWRGGFIALRNVVAAWVGLATVEEMLAHGARSCPTASTPSGVPLALARSIRTLSAWFALVFPWPFSL